MLDFSKLETPAEDGSILIEPPAQRWPALIARNRKILESADYEMAGRSLREVRDELRGELAGASIDRPVLAAGHQPEFAHPGVWAKNVALRHVADQLGHGALDLVVDNHAPRSGHMTVPLVNGRGWVETRRVKVADLAAGASYEGRPKLDERHWQQSRDEIQALVRTWTDASCVEIYLNGLGEAESPRDFVDQHLAGRRALDRSFETALTQWRVSDVYGGSFVADLLLKADAFASCYNESLAGYRRTYGVADPNRPLPDLGREGDRIESPFWVYRPGGPRRRLWLEGSGERIALYGDTQQVGALEREYLKREPSSAMARLAPWRIRPRALTLTLWARLLACDLFIHGIGGAKYDRITDRILEKYYGIEPPAYACVSATLRLPLPRREGSEAEVRTARQALRDLYYNPQRYLASPAEDLLERRRALIAESDRLRRQRGPRLKRHEVYREIREVNAALRTSEAGLEERMAERVELLECGQESNELANSREYFYALQPRARLERLAQRLREGAAIRGMGEG